MNKLDMVLNNLQWLVCQKKKKKTKLNQLLAIVSPVTPFLIWNKSENIKVRGYD